MRRLTHLSHLSTLFAFGLALSACATQGGEGSTGPGGDTSTDPQRATDSAAPAQGPQAPRVALEPVAPSTTMHEVFLDPTGKSALTVDRMGRVHLWPRLLTADEVRPFELPIHEPQFLSMAKDADGTVRLASIDASGATVMGSVTIDGESATYTELLRLPPHDSALEVHILADGRRALWLGLDHSIRLYDLAKPVETPEGAELSRVQRTAFVPWQLRLTHGQDGTQDHAVAIIAGPTRAVPLTIGDTSLETGAETPALPLDRGPNRNDLALTPDGKRLVMLRRPGSKTKDVHLYVHELGNDRIDLLGGEVDVTWRGRMMLTGPTTALIETGMGKGFSFDLGKAVPLDTVKIVKKRRKERPAPVIEPSTSQVLARLEAPPDREFEFDIERYAGKRVHVDFQAGVRALPDRGSLIVDPLDSDTHFVHGATTLEGRTLAFSPDGETIAVGSNTELVTYKRDTMTELGRRAFKNMDALAFIDDQHLVGYGRQETLEVFSTAQLDAKPVETLAVPVEWVPARHVFVRDDRGLTFYVRGDRPAQPAFSVAFTGTKPGEIKTLKGEARTAAAPLFEENLATDKAGNQYAVVRRELDYPRWSGEHDDHRVLVQTASGGATVETPIRRGIDAEIVPDPTGSRIAIRQGSTLSVYETADMSRAWTRSVSAWDIEWSADGSELGIVGSQGLHVYGGDDGKERASKVEGAALHEERKDDAFLK